MRVKSFFSSFSHSFLIFLSAVLLFQVAPAILASDAESSDSSQTVEEQTVPARRVPPVSRVVTPAKTIVVHKLTASPAIDGVVDDVWNHVEGQTDFVFPWTSEIPQKTTFKSFYNDDWLYFLFVVEDKTPAIVDQFTTEMDVTKEDRAEVFLGAEPEMALYYGFETSPSGKLDYSAKFYREFDNDWNCDALDVSGRWFDGYYVVEWAFPLDYLRQAKILNDDMTLSAGFYRADLVPQNDGSVVEKWATWIDPEIDSEDFHIPATLGRVVLD